MLGFQVGAKRPCLFGDIPQHQWRLQRYRAEAVRSNAAGLTILVTAANDSNAGREFAEALPEFFHRIHQ